MPGPIADLLYKPPQYDWAPITELTPINESDCFICMSPYSLPTPPSSPNCSPNDAEEEEEEQHEPCTPIRLLPCNHIVGDSCIDAWIFTLDTHAHCPLCRTLLQLVPQTIFQKIISWICTSGPIYVLDSALIPITNLHRLPMSVYRSSDSETVDGIWYIVFSSLTLLICMMVMGGESGVMRLVRLIMWVWLSFWTGLMATTCRDDEYGVGEDRNTGGLEDDAGDLA
jgi:hypothetical protein